MNAQIPVLWLILASVGFVPLSTHAAFLSIRSDARAEIISNRVVAGLTVVNQGDESARSVSVSAGFQDRLRSGPVRTTLPPNEPLDVQLDLGPLPAEPGLYPIVFKIHYADANLYPFSALAFHSWASPGNEIPPPALLSLIQPLSFSDQGTLKLKLKSLVPSPLDVNLRLYLPDELSCDTPELNLLLAPGRDRIVEFPLVNFSGRPGSRYTILVVLGYRQDGGYYGIPAVGSIEIRAARPLLNHRPLAWMGVVLLLILAGGVAQWIRIHPKT
jgi:hypothetical protein